MNSSARPNSCCRSCSRLTICALTETSSAETASSQTIRSGSAASARAMPMRWRWPPENSCGRRSSASRGRPHGVDQRHEARGEVGGGFGEAEIADRLGQDVAHSHARIEAGERILEHHLDAAAHAAQPAGRQIVDAPAVQHHLARGDVEQPQDGAADRRLAAAGFADQRQRLAARDLERHAVDRVDDVFPAAEQAAAHRKVLFQIVDLKQRDLQQGRAHAAAAAFGA